MTIDIQILTTTAAILDADGRTGVGTIRIRPNQPFQYNDGVTDIQVTDAVTEIAVSGGQLQSALTLAPNTGASNVPASTYYIVEVDVNTITYTEYWRLSNTPTSLEWGEVTRLANPEDAGGDLLTAHIQASNPHRQYLLRSDTVDAATAGTVSDGRGAIPRLDPATGKLPTGMIPSGATITAATVTLADAAGNFTTDNVEAALAQIASTATPFIGTTRIVDAAVTLAKMANLAADTIIGRANGAGTGVPTALTAAQVATIIRSLLLSDAIANGETDKAPTQNAVYDAMALKVAKADVTYEATDTQIVFAGPAVTQVGPLTNASSRKYIGWSALSVSAGVMGDIAGGYFRYSSGAGGFPNYFALNYTGAGATVTVRLYYIEE